MNVPRLQSDIQALLARADDYGRKGDARAAVSFYQAALRAASASRTIDPATITRLHEAQHFISEQLEQFKRALDGAIDHLDFADPVAATRLTHAVDMVKGSREIFPQQPSMFYYPYLAQRQFFEPEEFDWAADLEAATDEIQKELQSLLNEDADFLPYVEDDPDRPTRDFHGLNNNRAWTALYLWKHGQLIPDVAERCPATLRALKAVPLSRIGDRTPSVFFSRLEPGAHIPRHAGMLNARLICHLPLIAPQGCWLRVGNETRQWQEGKLMIFDDSIEHEAKNPTAQIRVVLIFDIWRPELSNIEREGVSAMFRAIDQFRRAPEG